MPKIIPLRELKNPSAVSTMCHESTSPVFVTKNGVSDLVILTSDAYDRLVENAAPPRETRYKLRNESALYAAEPVTLTQYMAQRDAKPLYTIAELKKTLSPIFKKHKVRKATLFGSYVKGTATTRSDVDLVVDSGLKGLAFYGLLNDVTEALRFPVDLIEQREIQQGSDMAAEIEDTGVTIYG